MGFDVPLQQDLLKNTLNTKQDEQANGLLNQDMSVQGQQENGLLNQDMSVQGQQENGLLNQDISMQGQQKNISSFEQFNNNMSMQGQQPEQEKLNRQTEARQQKDGWMTVAMKETEEEMQKDYDKAHVTDSKSLEKAADVRFQNSIDSRKGSCETRTAHKKRLAAGKKLKHRAGLTEHSLKLSDDLQSHTQSKDERLANRQAEGEKYYDNWANNTIEGKNAVEVKAGLKDELQGRKGKITAEEQRKLQAPEMKVLCFLPNDEARAQLLSNSASARDIAYEKLVTRAMDFDLQPNALCTLAAMQNAVKVQEHGEIVDAVREYINADKFAAKEIPEYMTEKFDKFEQVFNTLRSGTEATAKLQGINLDGSNVYNFDKDMTAGEKKTLEATRKANQKEKSRAISDYEKSLAAYNKEFTGKRLEAKQEEEVEYITKGKLNYKDYQMKYTLQAMSVKVASSMRAGAYLNEEWAKTEYGSKMINERLAVEKKMDQGIAITEKEEETISKELRAQLASLLPYIEISDADNLFGNDSKLRAVAEEKALDKLLAMPITINADINYYFNEASPEETAAIMDFNGDASAMYRTLRDDKIAVQNIPAEKREKFSTLYDSVSELAEILETEAPLRGYTMEGEQYECTEDDKQRMADKKARHMEPYQKAAVVYNEVYNDSDELSQQKIATAKSELGTDFGITKHTIDMADALRRQQPPKARFGVKRTQAKKEDFLPEYSSARTKATKMSDLMESVMGFKLDIKNASSAPDMKNIPEIIAHGKKVEEAKQHIKEAQELKVAIPESAMARWVSYSAAFDALYSTAEAVVGMQGLTIEGESRYAQNPEMTADAATAERYQLSSERELVGERAKQLITDYNKQHIESTYEGSLEVPKAAKLLGTTLGVTPETYGLATTLRANIALSKSNAEEGKKLRESDALKPMIAKQDEIAAKKHEITEEEKQILPKKLNKSADELLHLVQEEDKAKLFSESPEERASVYVKLIDILLNKEVPENLYDPAFVQKLPEMAQLFKECSALETLWGDDSAAGKFIPSGVVMRLGDLKNAIFSADTYQKALMQEHGIDEKGESLHKGADTDEENYFMFENARQLALTEDKDNRLDESAKEKPRQYNEKQTAAKAKWHEQGGGDNEFTERFAADQKKRAKGAQNAK